MDEYVKKEAVKEWLLKWEGYIDMDIIARMQYRVIDIPATDPPVKLVATISFNEENLKEIVDKAIVKCGDCTKYDTHDHRCKYWNHGINTYDFCSKGVRRSDAEIH